MSNSLQGRIAVVTGAGRGVGRHIALALAGAGVSVALVARSRDQLAQTEHEIRQAGGVAHAIAADVSQIEAVEILQREVESALGRATILINAAGVFGPIQLIKESDPQSWLETLSINTGASYLTCRAFMNGMIEEGWGRIVNVSSAAALHTPGPLNSAYGTSKAALNQFTRHLAVELEGTGVTANVIHPGEVKTEMWDYIQDAAMRLGSEGEGYREWVRWVDETGGDPPEKAAALVLRLMSSATDSITGEFLWIEDGLQKPIPHWKEVMQLP